jgi:diacylglycerol kinase family enzyme
MQTQFSTTRSEGTATAPVPVLVNAAAGGGHNAQERQALEQMFRSAGVEARIVPTTSGADLRSSAERLLRDKPSVIVAGGGDGTINALASVLAGSDVPLGVLPLGTLNHFAKDLRIPLDLSQAAATIAAGHSTCVDVGEVNGRIFVNNSSLGLYPHIVRDRDSQQRRLGRGKWAALMWATWTVTRRSPFLRMRLCLDDQEQQYTSTFVFIGNNEYVMEGFNIGQRERLDGGRLSVYVTHRRGRAGLFMLGVRALFGRLHQARDFDVRTAQTLTVETSHKQLHVATDGEVVVMETPLAYRIRTRALRVIVPAPSAAA